MLQARPDKQRNNILLGSFTQHFILSFHNPFSVLCQNVPFYSPPWYFLKYLLYLVATTKIPSMSRYQDPQCHYNLDTLKGNPSLLDPKLQQIY